MEDKKPALSFWKLLLTFNNGFGMFYHRSKIFSSETVTSIPNLSASPFPEPICPSHFHRFGMPAKIHKICGHNYNSVGAFKRMTFERVVAAGV